MDTEKMLHGLLAGDGGMLILGGLRHMVIMGDFYNELGQPLSGGSQRWLLFGILVMALLMAYGHALGYQGGMSVNGGLILGVLIGLLVFLPFKMILHGPFNFTRSAAAG